MNGADDHLMEAGAKRVGGRAEPSVGGLTRTGVPFGGVVDDIRRRGKHYVSDWTDGICWKTPAGALYMFFATFASTVALGELARSQTDGHIGVTEYLMLQSVSGITHTLVAGQPLLILRPTGPITVFVTELYTLGNTWGFNFYQWLGWVGIWVGVYMTIMAAFDATAYIKHLTRFLHDLYAAFVCTIYTVDGIQGVVSRFHEKTADGVAANYADALFELLLAGLVVGIGLWLLRAERSRLFTRAIRQVISDYALALAVFVAIAISYAPGSTAEVKVDRIPLPSRFGPTFNQTGGQYHPRQWLSPLDPSPVWIVGAAAVAAIPIVALFYIDQNISALLTQVPSVRLAKGGYFHFSFLLTGVFNLVLPMFGMPFVTASLPHSPQFARSLSDLTPKGEVIRVHENRIAPLLVYTMCGLAIFAPTALEVIPEGVVNGILTFVGLAGLLSKNQFVERVFLLVTHPEGFPKDADYTKAPVRKMHLYTFVQLVCLGCCWVIKQTPAGLAFPVFIVLLIPFRSKVMPMMFSQEELACLDSEDLDDGARPGGNGKNNGGPDEYTPLVQ